MLTDIVVDRGSYGDIRMVTKKRLASILERVAKCGCHSTGTNGMSCVCPKCFSGPKKRRVTAADKLIIDIEDLLYEEIDNHVKVQRAIEMIDDHNAKKGE